MTLTIRPRIGMATLLCLIAALSAVQTIGIMPSLVSADNQLTIQLTRAPVSTEPTSASGSVLVNLDNGQAQVKLHHATPNVAYTVLFVSNSATSTVQVGNFVTGLDGEGSLQGTLSTGAYAGVFQVTKVGIVQYASNNTAFSIGLNVSLSAAISNSTTTESTSQTNITQSTSSTNSSQQLVFEALPPFSTVTAGAFAKFYIHIAQNSSSNIFLVANGVPPGSVGIFTPNAGQASPEFNSTLTIATSADTPTGSYEISIVATVGGKNLLLKSHCRYLPQLASLLRATRLVHPLLQFSHDRQHRPIPIQSQHYGQRARTR